MDHNFGLSSFLDGESLGTMASGPLSNSVFGLLSDEFSLDSFCFWRSKRSADGDWSFSPSIGFRSPVVSVLRESLGSSTEL